MLRKERASMFCMWLFAFINTKLLKFMYVKFVNTGYKILKIISGSKLLSEFHKLVPK
jgi:hypothetical protein